MEPAAARPFGPRPRPLCPLAAGDDVELAPGAFARWASETPRAVALSAGGRNLTYADLQGRAERIAGALLARGVGPGDVVAVSGRKRMGLVAALMGVLGSGAAMLPLDPALPARRRRDMARAGAAVLELSVDGEDGAGIPWLAVGADGEIEEGGERLAGDPCWRAADGEDAAYLVFTSGTTGEPAGVEGSHAALALFLAWQRETFGVGPGDRVPFLTGLSFDVMLRDLLLPLTSGATLCLPPDGLVARPEALRAWLADEGVTLLHAVPSLASTWLSAPERPSRLRVTFFAGEPLAGALVTRWRAAFPSTRVVNLYGPTETTLARYWHEVGDEPEAGAQPVGSPIPHTETLILDAHGAALARGEAGEVAIRTRYRARRLLGARQFSAGPAGGPEPVYRTGDRGRIREDGALELLGRLDDQVKVNGVRVDPGEVAAHLLAHPAVHQAAVVPRDGRLVAYVVADERDLPLRSFVAQRLPAAMVPSSVVFLDRMPLTERGKLDRDGLPPPFPAEPAPTPPEGETERLASGLWEEVLGRAPGRHESFLDLGGTSLDVIAFLVRLEERHGVELEPSNLFEEPTIAGIARRIETRRARASGAAATFGPGSPVDGASGTAEGEAGRDDVPLTPPQRRLWLDLQLRGLEGPAYLLAWAMELRGPLRLPAFQASLDRVVSRHPALRTTFPLKDGLPAPRVHVPAPLELPVLDLTDVPPEVRDGELRRRASELVRPGGPDRDAFDLNAGPLFRAAIARLSPERHVALFVAHHLVLDGWSRWLLIRELLEGYAEPPAHRPPAGSSYAEEARRLAGTPPDPAGLGHFTSRLRGARPLTLPVDGPRPDSSDPRGSRLRAEVPAALRSRLGAYARERGATAYMVLLAAFQLHLGRWCGQEDVTVGSPVAGRTTPGSESPLGCFINLVALRADLSGEPSFETLVDRVREEALAALAHQTTPFEAVVEALRPPRLPGRTPLVDVLLNVVNVPQAPPSLPDLEISYPDDLFEAASPFAMTLYVRERTGGLELTLLYRRDLFSTARMEGFLRGYVEQLTEALADPLRPLHVGEKAGPSRTKTSPAPGRTPPEGPVEEAIAALWREQLGAADVAREDGFFELGGDSLAAVRFAVVLGERLGVDLPLRALLESPTLRELAARVASAPSREPVGTAIPRTIPGRAPIPLAVSQARLLARIEAAGMLESSSAFNVPRAVSLTGPLDVARLERALRQVVAAHGALRARFLPGPLQVVERGVGVRVERLDVKPDDVPSRIAEEGRTPFQLGSAPLLRARLLRLAPEAHVLLLTAHHLVADCWSMGIPFPGSSGRWLPGLLVEEVARRYAGNGAGPPPPPAWGPAERIAAEAAWLEGDEARAQREYWEGALAGAPRLDLAPGRPRPPAGRYDGVRHRFALPPEASQALRALARSSGATLFETLLTIFGAFLHEETGARDVVVGTPVSGRARPELASMIGFLGNHVAIRSRVDGEAPFRERLALTSAACREAFARQDFPVELLGEEAPFSVRLVLHRADRPPIEAGDLVFSPHPAPREIAKHDLTLLLVDAGEGPLEGWLETPAGLFERDALERIARRLADLSEAATLPSSVRGPAARSEA